MSNGEVKRVDCFREIIVTFPEWYLHENTTIIRKRRRFRSRSSLIADGEALNKSPVRYLFFTIVFLQYPMRYQCFRRTVRVRSNTSSSSRTGTARTVGTLASNRTLRIVSKLSMRKGSYFRLASIRSSMTFRLHLL